jgi:3-dehydroquinate synthase
MVGFVASTYMRGLRFGFVASTLLAQVDAAVGGKNGVNFGGFKNIVGVFNQPDFVICDLELLQTLPPEEIACGLAEIVKHAAIADAAMFAFLEESHRSLRTLEPTVVEKLVHASLSLKAGIVDRDERETGPRRVLNFGHTIGHALEALTGRSHGEAVSIGMAAAARISEGRGRLAEQECRRLVRLLERLQLPTGTNAAADDVVRFVRGDKKRRGEALHFVLLQAIGEATVESLSLAELEDDIRRTGMFA